MSHVLLVNKKIFFGILVLSTYLPKLVFCLNTCLPSFIFLIYKCQAMSYLHNIQTSVT